MSWILVGQISVLMMLAMLLALLAHSAIVDKNREDDIKRKQAGVYE